MCLQLNRVVWWKSSKRYFCILHCIFIHVNCNANGYIYVDRYYVSPLLRWLKFSLPLKKILNVYSWFAQCENISCGNWWTKNKSKIFWNISKGVFLCVENIKMIMIYENIFSKFTHIVCNHFRYGLRNNGFKIKAWIKIKDLYDVLMVLIYQSYILYSKIMHSPLQKNPQK